MYMYMLLTVDVAVFTLVVCAKAIACDARVMVDTTGTDKAEIVPRITHIGASFVDILMLGGHKWCYRQ